MEALSIVMIAVAGALALIIVLSIIAWRSYKGLTRREAADFRIYNEYAEPGGTLFLGDSLTDFFPVNEYFASCNRLYNRGIAGNTTLDVQARLADAVALSPAKVFLQIGINDMIYLSRKKSAPDRLADRIVQIADAFAGACVYVLSLYPVNRRKSIFSKVICLRARNKRVLAVNARLKDLCEQKGYTYIDVHARLLDEHGNLAAAYTLEGLHLSAKGYAAVADQLKPYIEA